MFRNCAAEMMSRRRAILIWTLCLAIVLVVYFYLPYNNNAAKRPPGVVESSPDGLHAGNRHMQEQITQASTALFTTIPTTISSTAVAPTTVIPICSLNKKLLFGVMYVNKTAPTMKEINEELSVEHGGSVENGGSYMPKDCIPIDKLAIVIPYRNRSDHLRILLRQLHPIMERQRHEYRIIVIEQAGNYSFNRAMLLNVGFLEALKIANFTCFVFHDVDHILENDNNYYGCPEAPKLLGVSVERQQYSRRRIMYSQYFGGVGAFSREQFEKINGYSNIFWGWGGEDDDAYTRVSAAGYSLIRAATNLGRYIMLTKKHVRADPGPKRGELLKTSVQRMYRDGLNTIRYKILEKHEYPLYTHFVAKLPTESYVIPLPTTIPVISPKTSKMHKS